MSDQPSDAEARSPADEQRFLGRYRALQLISIVLIVVGLASVVLALTLAPDSFRAGSARPSLSQALLLFAAVGGGGLAVIVGLLLNGVRAIIVRQALPESRYRGPAITVLLLLATIFSILASAFALSDVQAVVDGGEVSVGGGLLILTVTQMGLVAVAIGFVGFPRALAGVRLVPQAGTARSILLGLLLAAPAWIGATLAGFIVTTLLRMVGLEPQAGVVDEAVAHVDPTVLLLAIVLVAPVAEELFFRGVVFNAWLREYGVRTAILGSAALFAAIHADPSSTEALIGSLAKVIPIFGLGVGLALVYQRTRSLLAPMAMHAGFNAISLSVALIARLTGTDIPV